VAARALERHVAHAVDVRRREVRAGDEQRPAPREVVLGDVVLGHRHVRAVLAQEDEREGVAVLDAEHDAAGQPRRVDAHVARVAALARDRLDEEAAEVIVADSRDQPGLQAQPRTPEGGVRRRAAEVLREARDVLEPCADLLRVEVDGEAPEAQHVEVAPLGEGRGVAHRGGPASGGLR